MSHAYLRRRASFLSAMCLLMAVASGFVFLSMSAKAVAAHHSHTKWAGLYLRQAVAEGAVTIDYERLNEIMGTTGTERSISRDTEFHPYVQQRWINPAVRKGLVPVIAISFVHTLVFFFLAIFLWSDRPGKA